MDGEVPSPSPSRKLGFTYRLFRSFFRFLTSIWFREVNLVDDESLGDEAGVLFITWHPNGLIDPMLMTARLPGRVTTLVHHRLFNFPFVGWLFRAAGVIPIGTTGPEMLNIVRGPSTAAVLATSAEELANGGRVLMFPEENTHGASTVQHVRSGVSRLLLSAYRKADALGRPRPRLVPVGLHYSNSHRFRERAAIVLERAMALPEPPAEGNGEAWVEAVTNAIEVELGRVNHAKSTWRDRTLIWKGRSVVHAEKMRQSGEALTPPSYAEAVLGARRLRAGWEYMVLHDPRAANELVELCEAHFQELDRRSLRPIDIDARPPELTASGYLRVLGSWLWSLVWMFGLVTWGAMIGNYVPYKFQSLVDRWNRSRGMDDSLLGSVKVLSSLVVFPLWWLLLSLSLVWTLLDDQSPVYSGLASHQLLRYVTDLPAAGMFVFFMVFWPLAARAHMKLYARLVRSTRRLRQWTAWKDETNEWQRLVTTQRSIAARLVGLGAALVLPGDPDWEDPPAGHDDVSVVRPRGASPAGASNSPISAQGFE